MQRKTFLHLQIKWKRVSLIVIALFLVLQPFNLFGEETKQEVISKIEIKDGLINADLKDAYLPEVLKEIEKRTGVKIKIDKELEGKKVTASFKELDVERALRTVLGNNYVFVFFKEKDKYVLKEVMTAGVEFGSKITKGKMITIDIPYGKGKREVGAVKAGEGANIGPLSFTVDDKGNIYICDTVNERIQVFSPRGEYLSTIPIKKAAADISIDKDGSIYIYADIGKIYQYDKKGNIVHSINVDRNWWIAGEPLHIVGNRMYVYTCKDICGDLLIGEIVNGKLRAATNEERKKSFKKGKQGLSDERYMASLVKSIDRYEGKMEIIDKDGVPFKSLTFPLEGISGVEFMGEDTKSNLYVSTSRVEDKTLIFEAHKFDADGNYLSTIRMSEEGDYFWAVKSLLVGKDGTIYRFMTREDKAKLYISPSMK